MREVFPPRAVVDRQPLQGPGVLPVNPDVAVQLVGQVEWRVQKLSLERHAVLEQRTGIAVGHTSTAVFAPGFLHADLDVVRAGHVGHRPCERVTVGILPQFVERRVVLCDERQIPFVDGAVPRGRPALLRNARLVDDVVALVVGREPTLHEDPVGQGRRNLCRASGVNGRIPNLRGGCRIEPGCHRRAAILADPIVIDGQFVLRADLPDEARLRARDALRIHPGGAVRIESVGWQRVEMKRPRREEEPHLVLLDRSAERGLDIGQSVDAIGGFQAARFQVVGEVVGLEALVLIAGKGAPAEMIAAVFRNHVQPHPTARHVGRRAAGRVDHFLAH